MMKTNKKLVISVALCFALCLCLGIAMRIYLVNANALTIPSEVYGLNEQVALDGSFVTTSKEQTLGYSLIVNDARLISYNDYCKKYGYSEGLFNGSDAKAIVEVEIVIKNEGNSEGYLDVMGWRLIPEKGNEYFIINSSLWQIGEPNAPGETSALSLVPNSEYSVSIPFVRNVAEEKLFTEEIDDLNFKLLITDAPVKKEIDFTV